MFDISHPRISNFSSSPSLQDDKVSFASPFSSQAEMSSAEQYNLTPPIFTNLDTTNTQLKALIPTITIVINSFTLIAQPIQKDTDDYLTSNCKTIINTAISQLTAAANLLENLNPDNKDSTYIRLESFSRNFNKSLVSLIALLANVSTNDYFAPIQDEVSNLGISKNIKELQSWGLSELEDPNDPNLIRQIFNAPFL